MSPSRGLFRALIFTLILTAAQAAGADPVRVIASDDRGVTLRIEVPEALAPEVAPDGRTRLRVPGFDLVGTTGLPRVPFASALVALPPGARPRLTLLDAGAEIPQDVELERGPQAVFHPDPGSGELLPDWEPAAPEGEAIWPASPIELGEAFTLRRQSMVKVTFYPWRYDARARRVWKRSVVTARLDFGVAAPVRVTGAALTRDRASEVLFGSTVINPEQSRGWQQPARALDARSPVDRLFAGGSRIQGAGFDEDQPEVRVLLDSTNVYALDFDALAASGYPAAVPIAQVSVHRHEFLEDAQVPYATLEIPSEVEDVNGNGTFDSGDRVIVFVQSWAERAQASVPQRAWGWGEVVYVTRVLSGGLRPAQRSGWLGLAGLTPPASFPHLQHYEQDVDYFNIGSVQGDSLQDPYHWTIQAPYFFRDESVTFDVNDLDTSRTATVTISWQGRSGDTHYNWAQVRNASGIYTTVVDDSVNGAWQGRNAHTVGRTIFGSSLSEGPNNRLRLWGKTFNSPPVDPANNRSQAGLNWFDITYGRRYKPIQGILHANNDDLTGDYELLARGFTDSASIRVYDVTDPALPVRLIGIQKIQNGATWDVRIQDNAASRRQYVFFDAARPVDPAKITTVTRRQLHANTAGDYLLIVPEAFLSAVDPLVQLRQSQGYTVVVAPLESVLDEFNGGRKSSHAIKRFVRYGFLRWNTQYVMLVGDGSEDPRHIDPLSGTDWVPIHRILAPVLVTSATTGTFLEAAPSDPWYGFCLDCAEPSLQPRIPEVFVGRIPVNSLAQAQSTIAKIVAYDQPQTDESWRRKMTLVSDDAYSGESFFSGGGGSNYCRKTYEEVFREINEIVHDQILDVAMLKQSEPEVFNIRYYLPFQPNDTLGCAQPVFPATDTCRCRRSDFETRARASVTPELMTRLNAGRVWFNYQGHANERVMSHESFYINQPTRDDKDLLMNDGRPFLYTGFSCHPNAFAHFQELGARWGTPSYGEDLVTLGNNRGAIASWASVGYELLPLSASSHLNVHFARALFGAVTDSLHREPYVNVGYGGVLGEVIATALLNNYKQQPNSQESNVGISYTLLGDPATRISLGPPQSLVTANTQPVTSGTPVRLRIGRDSLRIEADVASSVRIDSLALIVHSPSGATAVIDPSKYTVTPAFPDTSVSGSGRGRRYHLSFRDSLVANSYRYTIRSRDQNGKVSTFDVVLAFETVLLADGNPVADLDVISPNAAMTMRLLSPRALDPATELTLRVGGVVQPFTFVPDNGDTSGREWVLSWDHAPYPFGETSVELSAVNGATRIHRFRVNVLGAELRLENPLAFPNPFEDDLGTHFSFTVESASATDVRIRVYTVSGRLVYEVREMGMSPGYHQIAWDGRDAEGDKLANGLYVYKIIARNDARTATFEGRLVKLRKPRRVEEETPVAP